MEAKSILSKYLIVDHVRSVRGVNFRIDKELLRYVHRGRRRHELYLESERRKNQLKPEKEN